MSSQPDEKESKASTIYLSICRLSSASLALENVEENTRFDFAILSVLGPLLVGLDGCTIVKETIKTID